MKMIADIVGFLFVVSGGVICYGAKGLYKLVFKKQASDSTVLKLKIAGFLSVVIGAVILFLM